MTGPLVARLTRAASRESARGAADAARRSLWRAHAIFRVAAAVFCIYADLRFRHDNDRPGLALVVVAAIAVWTVVGVAAALRAKDGNAAAIAVDVVVVVGLTLLTLPVQAATQLDGSTPTLTTLWAAAPSLAAGIRGGWRAGLAAAVVQAAASLVVRHGYDGRTLTNIVLLVLAGGLVGYVSTLFVRAQAELAAAGAELAAAGAERAALAERERLSRGIHDGVLQVLALVQRRGAEIGGAAAELGRLAGEQERSLRSLITDHARVGAATAGTDLSAALLALRTERVTVSAPAEPVIEPAAVVVGVRDAVAAALSNVERHAGDAARAWVLLDADAGELTVLVRDDGPGFAPGRLDAAVADGRLGVSSSIVGRVRDLGGTAEVCGTSGAGVEVQLRIPRGDMSTTGGSG